MLGVCQAFVVTITSRTDASCVGTTLDHSFNLFTVPVAAGSEGTASPETLDSGMHCQT